MKSVGYIFKIFPLVFLLTFVSSCDSNDPGPSGTTGTTPPRTADDVREDFQALTINPGVNDLILESVVAGVYWNFRIIVPADASASNKRPMIMRLHGGATGINPTAHKTTACLAEPGLASLNAYIISPNSDGSHWYANQNIVQVQALVDLVQTYLHVDTNKVAVMGYSDGGNGSWFFSQYLPNLFSAAIPMASSYAVTTTTGVTHQFVDPIYAIHGENDQLFPLATTQGYVNETVNAGSDVTFVVATGLEHYNSCDYVSYLQDAASWLENTVWN